MKPGWRKAIAGAAAFAFFGLAAGSALGGGPALYRGEGDWGAAANVPAGAEPSGTDWAREGDLWIGRVPMEGELRWGEIVFDAAEAQPPPLAATRLPGSRNAFGSCLVRSLTVRFQNMLLSRRWSLVLPGEKGLPDFLPLELNAGGAVDWKVELEDADSGRSWPLRPERMGIAGSAEAGRSVARLYAGSVDEGSLEWYAVATRGENGRQVVQARARAPDGPIRRLRMRIQIRAGAPGVPVAQEEMPPAVAAERDGYAIAMFADLAEPRRLRAAGDGVEWTGLEFEMAATELTGNFPRGASAGVEVDGWVLRREGAAAEEAAERLARYGGGVAVPESVLRDGPEGLPTFEPTRLAMRHPGGFRGNADALDYLMLRTSGLFADADWAASAFLCAAQDAGGEPRVALEGDEAVVSVNPDPDLETMIEMGQNRGLTLLGRIAREKPAAALIRAAGGEGGLDHHVRALRMCDYPALWDEETGAPGVAIGHAEAELLASLSCALRERGICLLVEDAGPLAPFTTAHADAIVCASAEAKEMVRQRRLAGRRPVLWTAEAPDGAARALADELGFAWPGKTKED